MRESLIATESYFQTTSGARTPSAREVVTQTFKVGFQIMIFEIIMFSMYFINSVLVAGRHDLFALGSMGLGNSTYHMFAEGLGYGFALRFLVKVIPIVANNNHKEAFKLFYSTLKASLYVTIPICLLFLFAYPIFRLSGSFPHLAYMAYIYVITLMPSVIFAFWNWICFNFLVAYNRGYIFTIITGLSAIVDIAIVYWVSREPHPPLGWVGFAVGLYHCLRLAGFAAYCKYFLAVENEKVWIPPSESSFDGASKVFQKSLITMVSSLPLALMTEANVFMAGAISEKAVAAQMLIMRVYTPILFIVDDLSYAVISRILYYRSINDTQSVTAFAKYGTKTVILTSVAVGIGWYVLKNGIINVFGHDPEIRDTFEDAFLYVGLASCLHGCLCHYIKVLRAHEMGYHALVIVLGCSFLVQIPLGIILCSSLDLGIHGIWIGFIITLVFGCLSSGFLIRTVMLEEPSLGEMVSLSNIIELPTLRR